MTLDYEEQVYNIQEEQGYQAKDIADLLVHYFLRPRKVIIPLGTVISELYALLKIQGWKPPNGFSE